jgi:hypothetical protein
MSSFNEPGVYSVDIEIGSLPLAPDIYSLDIGARSGDVHPLDYLPARTWLDIVPGPSTPGNIIRNFAGVRLESKWMWNRRDIKSCKIKHRETRGLEPI